MSPLTAPPATPLSGHFARFIEGLGRIVAARAVGDRALAAIVILLCNRLNRLARRFDALAASVRDGRTPAARSTPRPPDAQSPALSRPLRSPDPVPRSFGWLLRRVQGSAASRSHLECLLADPELTALIAAEPGLGRILRPLCRMLAIRPGPPLGPPDWPPRSPRSRHGDRAPPPQPPPLLNPPAAPRIPPARVARRRWSWA